jgi:ABC-type transport system substrate-binding protein
MLLASVLAAGQIQPVKAQTPIILWIPTTNDPGPGYYGGYHDVVALLQIEFAKIGIDLRWDSSYDLFMWEDIVWDDPTWGRNGTYDGDFSSHQYGVDGWDLAIFEWWMNPTSYIWGDELVYSWGTPDTGWNIMSWNDTKADYFYQQGATTLDPTTHNRWMWKWQEEAMHNPPNIPIYYADTMTAHASYLDGYDSTAWHYDLSQLDIDETTFNAVAPTSPYDRKAVGSDTVIWGAGEPIYDFTPTATLTYTEESVNVLKQGMLYRTSRENMAFPSSGDFTVIPTLAADFPDWYQKPDGRWVASVPLRSGVTWTSGVEFNATDVAYSYQALLTPPTQSQSYGDYSYLLDDVVVNSTYKVDFIYKEGMGPDYDFAGYQAHGWALGMLPYHQLGGTLPPDWSYGGMNISDPVPVSQGGEGLECLGPYVPSVWDLDVALELTLRSDYVSALGFSSTMPNNFIIKLISDASTRFIALQNLEVDFIEYPTAPLADWNSMIGWPTHRVFSYMYPAAHTLWIQHNSTILANRYVRLAIAHAIPYDDIINNVLPGWGVANAYRGKTAVVLPIHDSFHPTLGNYEYNITKAQQYMDMYLNSIDPANYLDGPLGDHDFSGFVEMADYPIWVNNLGKYTSQLPWYPSNPVDPDNNNDGEVLGDDFPYWGTNIGTYYPYSGAW